MPHRSNGPTAMLTTFKQVLRTRWLTLPPSSVRRELELDVVRGIAILLAMGFHFNPPGGTGLTLLDPLLWPAARFGWVGVDLFFVLSGFLVGRLIFKEWQASGGFDARRFLGRRALKLWPVLYSFVALRTVLGRDPWETFVPQILLHVQNYLPTPAVHLWSLAVEEHFYILLCLVFLRLARGPVSFARIAQLVGGVMLACLALRGLAVALAVDPGEIQFQTHYRVDALAMGVLLAALAVLKPEAYARLQRQRLALLAVLALAVAILVTTAKGGPVIASVGYTTNYLGAAALLLLCHRSRLVGHRNPVTLAVGLLGVYSYALYIWHASMIVMVPKILADLGLPDPPAWLTMALMYAGAVAIAIPVTRFVEWPFLALRDRLLPAARLAADRPAGLRQPPDALAAPLPAAGHGR